MPLTAKGEEIKQALEQEYGAKKGEGVFYAMENSGKLTGVAGKDEDPGPSVAVLPESVSVAELNARNRQFWEQPGGEFFKNE